MLRLLETGLGEIVSKIGLRFVLCFVAITAGSAAAAEPQFHTAPPFKESNARLPRLSSPATPATARINAAFDKLDARWSGFMRDCPKDGETARSVQVTMNGPQFFSVVVNEEESCGGAHPDSSTLALVYDVSTGKPVDWKTLLGPRAALSASVDTDVDAPLLADVRKASLACRIIKTG